MNETITVLLWDAMGCLEDIQWNGLQCLAFRHFLIAKQISGLLLRSVHGPTIVADRNCWLQALKEDIQGRNWENSF